MIRFPTHTSDVAGALAYYRNRATQFLCRGWSWDGNHRALDDWGVEVKFRDRDDIEHASVFVFEEHTGKGHLTRYFETNTGSFFTSDYCPEMVAYLEKRGRSHVRIARGSESYAAIEAFYGDQRAERSGQFYMNHIDEGLDILAQIGAAPHTKDAFCLHPIVQADEDFERALAYQRLERLPQTAVLLAMEYRSWANAHLPKHAPKKPQWGPTKAVRDMLMADKLQNRKDYERYLRGKGQAPNEDRLDEYFDEWFDALKLRKAGWLRWSQSVLYRTGMR
jgi:hypothetical protein